MTNYFDYFDTEMLGLAIAKAFPESSVQVIHNEINVKDMNDDRLFKKVGDFVQTLGDLDFDYVIRVESSIMVNILRGGTK
jgi:hypothetical protein